MSITQYAVEHSKELGIVPERLGYLDNVLCQWFDEGKVPALTTRIMRCGHCIFEGAYGMTATKPVPKPLVLDAIFPVAPITKTVTSMVLMQLQEDGILDLQDPVWAYLPGFEGKNDIQIWHLLTHTSGIRDDLLGKAVDDHLKSEYGIEPGEDRPHEEFVENMLKVRSKMGLEPIEDKSKAAHDTWRAIALKIPAAFKPRENMVYCNTGYQYAADIITKVTGESLEQVAKKKIFEPLSMNDTYWVLPKEKWNRVLLRPEGAYDGYPWMNSEECFTSGGGAGGLKTTVYDITRFTEAIRLGGTLEGERILSPVSVRAMSMNLNRDLPDNPGEYGNWAIGWNYRGEINNHLKNEYGVELSENHTHDEFVEKMLKVRAMMGLAPIEDDLQAARDTWREIELKIPADFMPRERMGYCNAGYQYCKDIITNIYGESIDAVAKKRIFDPIGMQDTHWILPGEKWDRVVLRSEGCEGYPWQNNEGCFVSESGAGGLKSTVYDMTRFTEAIRRGGTLDGGRLLSPVSVKAMVRDLNHDMPTAFDSWALGWNYRGTKHDDTGLVRPSTAIDHAGFGGCKILIDAENELSWSFFSVSRSYKMCLLSLFANIIYSALN